MPVYSFDMMYNIFKRLYANQRHIPTEVPANKFWEYVRLVYKDIENLLMEEDEYYFNATDDIQQCKEYKFSQKYRECPFINYIDKMYAPDNPKKKAENKKREKQRKLFEKNFSEMIINLYNISG